MDLQSAAAEFGLMSARIFNPGLPLKRICNSPAPQNSSAGRSMAYSPRRCNHSPYTSTPDRPSGHLQGTSGAQVNFTKVGTRYSGRHLMKKHLTQGTASCVNRWRTGESGLTDFG